MAFATKYLFKFNSSHGVEHQIHIQKDGYSGAVIQRPLGRSPKLVKKKNGPICGTSLELYAECHVDGEFAEMYTSNPKEWKVLLYRGGTLVWEGFVSPELYSEPSIAPPYDVQIVATDGLGELKLYKYTAQGLKALKTILSDLLSVTGLSLPFRIISQLAVVQSSPSNFFSHRINLDFMEEETYYDVLTRLLDSLHMTITQYKDKWYMVRETDVTMVSTGSLEEITISTSGTVSSTSEVVRTTAGQMGVAQMWPIGHLSTKIEPAKRSIKLQMPWHLANMFLNPNMATESVWGTNNDSEHPYRVIYDVDNLGGYALGKVSSFDPDSHIWGQIAQTISVKKLTNALIVSARVYSSRGATILSPHPRIACWAKFIPTNSANPTMWWYNGAWRDTAPSTIDSLSPESPTDNGNFEDGCVEAASTYEWNITGLGADYAGALQIYFGGDYVRVYAAALTVELYNKGYEDIININNGARGDGETLELIGGRITEDVIHIRAIQGIWLNTSDVADTSFTDSHWITGRDFLSLTALGHAISIADERIRTEGKLDLPSGMTNLPFVLKTTIDHFVETYEWDIAADEVSFSALSLPAVSLTVDSEVVREITGGTSGGSSSGGGGGASGGGVSMAEVQQWVTAQGYLTGITSAMVVAALGYTPASAADLSSLGVALQAPTLKIYRGYDRDTGSPKITPYLRVSHPLIGNTTLNPGCVLMVWDKRRGRFRSLDQGGHTQSNYRSGWGELRGKHATTAPLTFSGATITLDDIRQFILNKCVKSPSYSVAQMEAMTLATYEQNTTLGQDFGFRLTYDSAQTAWVVKKRSRLFGIAIRYENPAWANMVVGTAVETTREIQEVPRYIYSEVAPFRVHINRKTSGRTIGIQLQPIIGPVH
ncbi:MAG: hypothetical protein K6E61_03410 [Bacteroidales bacterium]|nr:hypothetical protein [Bacteroidales bacterium]